MRVDAQVHVVSPDRARYPLDPPPLDVPPWFERAGQSAEDLLVRMAQAGMDRVVLVQGFSAYRYDNRYTADSAAAHPDRFAAACIVDVAHEPIVAIRRWVAERGARAIRFFLQLGDGRWLDEAACDAALDELEVLGAIGQFAVNAGQLGGVLRAAARHPDLPILVDHCGYPDLSGGPDFPNARSLFALADAPNVHLKLSTFVFDRAKSAGVEPRRAAEAIVAAFGARRVMWASDLSVHDRPYLELIAEAEEACAGLGEDERRLVLGDAAAALWWPADRHRMPAIVS